MERVELNLHTNMSQMDGVTSIKDYINKAKEYGMTSLAITDHAVVQAFPEAQKYLERIEDKEFKVLYGMEGYVVDDNIKAVYNEKGQTIDTTYCILDIETTGFSAINNEIIEVAILKVKDNKIIDTFHSYIKPKTKLRNKIIEITHITNEMLENSDSIEKVFPKIIQFLEDEKDIVIVGHNVDFDIRFLKQNAIKLGYEFNYTYIDTLILAKVIYTNYASYKLGEIAKGLKIMKDNSFPVLDDVKVLFKVFKIMSDTLKAKDIKELKEINTFINEEKDKSELYKKMKTYHTTILAKNKIGLINLYKLVSISNLKYFYRKPRIIKSIIEEYSEGLLIGSSCEQGEVFEAILNNKTDEEIEEIIKIYDYIEIQPIKNNYYLIKDGIVKDEEELKDINKKIVELGKKYNKLVVATGNVHFLNKEDEIYRRILQAEQGYSEAENQLPLYFRTTEEMLEEFAYLEKETAYEVVVTNTNKIADMCEKINPISSEKCYPYIENSENDIKEMAFNGAYKIYGSHLSKELEDRLNKELKSIIENGFATIYIIAQRLVSKSNEDGYIVGTRGLVGSSLVAYCIGITEIDPIKYNIPFETFAGFKGDKEPDIDLNFAGEYQKIGQEYVKDILEGVTTYKGGTIGTLYRADDIVKKYYEEKNININKKEIERISEGLIGIKRTTGQHPRRSNCCSKR